MKNKITGVLLAVAVIAVASCGGDNNAVEDASTSTTTEVEPGAPQGDDFYVPPSPLPDGKPGDIIWSDTVTSRNGLTLHKVLYLSTTVADEPTADLDQESSNQVLATLREYAANGAIVICVSHDLSLLEKGDTTSTFVRGALS